MDEVVRRSQQLSRLLRHTAGARGLEMTADGWALIEDVCTLLEIDRTTLDAAVEYNDKKRLQVDGGRIRACPGRRTHVHLAPNGVLLARYVPVGAICDVTRSTGSGGLDVRLGTDIRSETRE